VVQARSLQPAGADVLTSRRRFLSCSCGALGLAMFGCRGEPRRVRTAPATAPSYADLFERITARARELASRPYVAPDTTLPAELTALDYDGYRSLRFRPARSLWRGDRSGWEAQLFHRGSLHRDRVRIHVARGDDFEELAFDPALFEYPAGVRVDELPRDLGFAGFRLHAAINRPDYLDEVVAFLGASYFRAVGRGQVYGLSARAIAIDTGAPSAEEFPRFTDVWLTPPSPEDARVIALLDGPRVAAAYELVVRPGVATEIDVAAHLFFRETPAYLGLAPLTSMFLAGEAERARPGDFRPEVHDSDGVAMIHGSGERLWRPLRNPRSVSTSAFDLPDPRGFGLLQRDASFESYQDLEALYHLRPSAWVEPRSGFGRGTLNLLELPSNAEAFDNVVLSWSPAEIRSSLSVAYRLSFGPAALGTPARGFVTATRIARRADRTLFIVSFAGGAIAAADPRQIELDLTSAAPVLASRVEPNPYAREWRAVFEIATVPQPVELRAFLRAGSDALTETWTCPWVPE
jgi:glucans biosynthesis protein